MLVEGEVTGPGPLSEQQLLLTTRPSRARADADPDHAVEPHRAHARRLDGDVHAVGAGEGALGHRDHRPGKDLGLVANVRDLQDQVVAHGEPGRRPVVRHTDDQVPTTPLRKIVGEGADRLAEDVSVVRPALPFDVVTLVPSERLGQIGHRYRPRRMSARGAAASNRWRRTALVIGSPPRLGCPSLSPSTGPVRQQPRHHVVAAVRRGRRARSVPSLGRHVRSARKGGRRWTPTRHDGTG